MAINPKSRNPSDAALSAVEEALRIDFGADEDVEGEARARVTDPPRAAGMRPGVGSARREAVQARQ
ncbi:MAG: hypothetical protein KIS96_15735, partial [Bauldia sp.]|nr:hypothetical protein [Bauldia sp.]